MKTTGIKAFLNRKQVNLSLKTYFIDAMGAMSANLRNLEHIVSDGFDQFVRLTRGENYLDLHEEDMGG